MKNNTKKKRKTSSLSKLNRTSSQKVGLPPGTLVYVGEERNSKSEIDIFNYSETVFTEKNIDSFDSCMQYLSKDTITWINIEGVHNVDIIKGLGKQFNVNNLTLEDVLNTNQRAKLEAFPEHMFMIMKMISYENNEIQAEQVSIIFAENYVLTLQEGTEGDVFTPIRERLRLEKSNIRKMGADYLVYALIDVVIDNYFVILENISEQMECLDDELINNPTPATLEKIYALKSEIIYIRKSIWPMREIINSLERDEGNFIKDKTKMFLRDVYDHCIQAIDNVETYRDIISGMMDLYLSSLSNKMNEIMKVLTIMGTIFIPLTFIVGVYGMNFEYMPELKMKYAYPVTWLIMISIALFMLNFFRRKKWI